MYEITLIGLYSHVHPNDISENRIENATGLLKNKGVKVNFIGNITGHDDDKVEKTRKKLIETIDESCCIILVYSGWFESPGILNIISGYLHLPIIIWSLAGYKCTNGIITPEAAGASLLRSSMDTMNVKYRCIYDMVDSETNLEEVVEFIHIFTLLKQTQLIKIASIGYACLQGIILRPQIFTGLKTTFLEVFEFFKDSVLMASCGFAPFSLCKQNSIKIHEHDWGGCGGLMNISTLKTGDITLFNIHNRSGKLKMQVFTGVGMTPENFQEEGWEGHAGPMIPAL